MPSSPRFSEPSEQAKQPQRVALAPPVADLAPQAERPARGRRPPPASGPAAMPRARSRRSRLATRARDRPRPANRSARSNCAAASRCEASAAARRAAAEACRSTAGPSPAASAWNAIRASSSHPSGPAARQDPGVDGPAPVGGDRRLDREPRDLMAEAAASCRPRRSARRRAAHRWPTAGSRRPCSSSASSTRAPISAAASSIRARVRAEPGGLGQHRVPGGGRDVARPGLRPPG